MKTYADYIADHDDAWRDSTYAGRPTPESLESAKFTAIWRDSAIAGGEKTICSAHDEFSAIEAYFVKVVRRMAFGWPTRRLVAVFENQQSLEIGIRVGYRVKKEL